MSKIIYLTQGYQTIVDDDDYENLIKFKWCASQHSNNLVYAKRGVVINDKYFNIYMHRQVMGLTPLSPSKIIVDHIDNNGLNNCKDNLRSVTHEQNMRNPNNKNHRGGKVGVTKCGNKWRARITINSKSIHLGLFIDEKDAIETRKKAEELYNKYSDEQVLQDHLVHRNDIYYAEIIKTRERNKTRYLIYEFIEQYIADHNYSPSMYDISSVVDVNISVVRYHLLRMEKLGLIERDANLARSIRIVRRIN